jgi:MFS family permease
MLDAPVSPETRRALRRAVPSLGVTGIIGWGTTYYLPAVLRERFQTDLGLPEAAVFAGVGVTLIVSALVAWPAGRLIDRHGAKRLLPVGALFLAAGLATLAGGTGPIAYFAAWTLFGFGMSFGLGSAAFAALTEIAGQQGRRAIALLMLFGGMAATIFWPVTMALDAAIGWRATLLVFAGLHVFVSIPLHLTLPGRRSAVSTLHPEAPPPGATGLIPDGKRGLAGGLIALMLASNGFVSWGLDLHLITLLQDYGLSAATAVALAAAKGPFTLVARVGEIAASNRVGALAGTFAGAILVAASLGLALTWQQGFAAALAFLAVHAFGTGLIAVARATLPLAMLGSSGYATTMGKIALPTQIVYAVSPTIFSLMMERIGSQGALSVALGASLTSLLALVALQRLLPGVERP